MVAVSTDIFEASRPKVRTSTCVMPVAKVLSFGISAFETSARRSPSSTQIGGDNGPENHFKENLLRCLPTLDVVDPPLRREGRLLGEPEFVAED